MARPGRPRKLGQRQPNGQLSRLKEGALKAKSVSATPELLAHRSESVGKIYALDARAGQPLGVLLLRGFLNDRQYAAGIRLQTLWRRWASLKGAPSRHAATWFAMREGVAHAWNTDEARLVARDFAAAVTVLRRSAPGCDVLSLVGLVCMDERLPPTPAALALLSRALTALDRHFRLS